MSSPAIAFAPSTERLAGTPVTRKTRTPRAFHFPWHEVPVATEHTSHSASRLPIYVWPLALGAIAAHLAAFWYLNTHQAVEVKPMKHEVAIEFVTPPKPPEPKIEPPKPAPPKQVQKQAQVLPPIEQPVAAPTANTGVSAEPPIAVAPIVSAPPAPEPELPVTAPFGKAGYLNNPPPEYPAIAARQNWEGTVTLRVHVLANGSVDSVEVQRSSGRKVLDDEAARTVKKWSFTPSKRGSTAVDGWATVPIEFKLDQ
jgi:protein TonB